MYRKGIKSMPISNQTAPKDTSIHVIRILRILYYVCTPSTIQINPDFSPLGKRRSAETYHLSQYYCAVLWGSLTAHRDSKSNLYAPIPTENTLMTSTHGRSDPIPPIKMVSPPNLASPAVIHSVCTDRRIGVAARKTTKKYQTGRLEIDSADGEHR